jgi:hypothetical protein
MTSTDQTPSASPARTIELPKSHIRVEEGQLFKKSDDGATVAMHPLEKIGRVRVVKKMDRGALVAFLILEVLAVVCVMLIPSQTWNWAAGIPLCLTGLIALIAAVSTVHLEIQIGNEIVSYDVNDDKDDAKGFEVTLNTLLTELKSKR